MAADTQHASLSGDYYRLSRIVGVTSQHLARALRSGENRLSFDTAVKVAAGAGVTLDELARHVYGEDEEMQKALKEIKERKRDVEAGKL